MERVECRLSETRIQISDTYAPTAGGNVRIRIDLRRRSGSVLDEPGSKIVPDTQPIAPKRSKSLHHIELPVRFSMSPVSLRVMDGWDDRANLHVLNVFAGIFEVRIPDSSCPGNSSLDKMRGGEGPRRLRTRKRLRLLSRD